MQLILKKFHFWYKDLSFISVSTVTVQLNNDFFVLVCHISVGINSSTFKSEEKLVTEYVQTIHISVLVSRVPYVMFIIFFHLDCFSVSLYKSPWARVFVYRGRGVRRSNGSATKQEVVCYPRDVTSTSNASDQYAPAVVPADLVHVRAGVAPPPGVILTVHAFPPQFALALGYIEVLVSQKYNFEYRLPTHEGDDGGSQGAVGGCPETNFTMGQTPTSPWRTFDSVVIPPPVLLHVTELLGGYLWRSSVPALIKEYVFHLLAQALRILSISESSLLSLLPTFSPKLSPTAALLLQLQTELNRLYEDETKNWPSDTTLIGTGIGLGIGDSGRFSTYFHALIEVCLAIAEVAAPEEKASPDTPVSTTSSDLQDTSPITSSTSLPAAPSSPLASSSTGKRKKLKAKRERQSSTGSSKQRPTSPKRTLSEGIKCNSNNSTVKLSKVTTLECGQLFRVCHYVKNHVFLIISCDNLTSYEPRIICLHVWLPSFNSTLQYTTLVMQQYDVLCLKWKVCMCKPSRTTMLTIFICPWVGQHGELIEDLK